MIQLLPSRPIIFYIKYLIISVFPVISYSTVMLNSIIHMFT